MQRVKRQSNQDRNRKLKLPLTEMEDGILRYERMENSTMVQQSQTRRSVSSAIVEASLIIERKI